MLEMLGVLGIMGIIMYGAVAGINYGMDTYKINQIYNEVQEVIQSIQDMYSWQRGYPKDFSGKTLCDNDVFVRCSDNTPKNTFEGNIEVKGSDCSGSLCNSFRVEYPGIPQEVCYRLQEMDWGTVFMQADCSGETNNVLFCPKTKATQTTC
jgi:type II secretory pathway pseudopilin PulG